MVRIGFLQRRRAAPGATIRSLNATWRPRNCQPGIFSRSRFHAPADGHVGVAIGPSVRDERCLQRLGARKGGLERCIGFAQDEVVTALHTEPEPARRLDEETSQLVRVAGKVPRT